MCDVTDGMASLEAVGGAVAGVDGLGALPDGGGSVRPAHGDSGGWRVAALTMERQRDTARVEVERLRSVVATVQALPGMFRKMADDRTGRGERVTNDEALAEALAFAGSAYRLAAAEVERVLAPVPSEPDEEIR